MTIIWCTWRIWLFLPVRSTLGPLGRRLVSLLGRGELYVIHLHSCRLIKANSKPDCAQALCSPVLAPELMASVSELCIQFRLLSAVSFGNFLPLFTSWSLALAFVFPFVTLGLFHLYLMVIWSFSFDHGTPLPQFLPLQWGGFQHFAYVCFWLLIINPRQRVRSQSPFHFRYLGNSVWQEEKTVIIILPKKEEEIMGLMLRLH